MFKGFFVKLVPHNDIYHLLELLIVDYEQTKTTLGVFGQYTIAVPNRSVENWLSAQIVQRVGISSGIRFESLHKLLHKVYCRTTPNPAELVDKNQLAGLFFEILTQLKSREITADERLIVLKNWLKKQNHQQSLANLSNALADVFELYQIHRVDWLDAWSEHKSVLGSQAEKWQAEIWRLLINLLPDTMLQHRRQLADAFAVSISQQSSSHSIQNIQQISVFGVNQLDAITLEQLDLVSRHISVTMFWQLPSNCLLGRGEEAAKNRILVKNQEAYFSGNALLASWGGLSRQQYSALETANIDLEDIEANTDAQADQLLSNIQKEVMNNTETDTSDASVVS